MRFGIWELLLILAIVVLLFGTRKIKSLGGDLGSAIKGFRSALREGEEDASKATGDRVIEGDSVKQGDKTPS
ncbi:MAG: twin-arginine translocase TatA/TatE family subunit [Gammaproteobacteria bacterium]|nr:twin-arginine translocase TatA/TatE family subunit [Gammaproteobacteria bacterium]MCG3144472.1 Sec-independent protein translocase protein TatA [Gammaproteobacteria bacterium]